MFAGHRLLPLSCASRLVGAARRSTVVRTPLLTPLLRRDMRTSVNGIKKGQVVVFRDRPWLVLKRDHGKTGRGGAVIKLELKDPLSGVRQVERYNPGDSLETMELSYEDYQYMYSKGKRAYFLHMETYEELDMDIGAIDGTEKHIHLLKDGMPITVMMLEGEKPLMYRLPKSYAYTITGDESSASQASKGVSYKTAYVADGKLRLSVPEFINIGDSVIVDLDTLEYMSRESKA